MFANQRLTREGKGFAFAKTLYLSFATCALVTLAGCEQPRPKATMVTAKLHAPNELPSSAETQTEEPDANTQEGLPFAPVTDQKRTHSWQGGVPPINKKSSEINTYYRLRSLDKPQHFQLTLRFEGAEADDASVSFQLIDGATFVSPEQQTQWRLRPNEVSELTFSVIAPPSQSYITLTTFQNNHGASRAFLLEIPHASKSSKK